MHIDYLIIGQGLAGSLLAWELLQRNATVLVIDSGGSNASKIAAGLINPVTGMRFVKESESTKKIAAAITLYRHLEVVFKQTFYVEKAMWRIIRNAMELEYYHKRRLDPAYRKLLASHCQSSQVPTSLHAPLGYIVQKQTGYLRSKPLLTSLKDYFVANGCYINTNFDYADIDRSNGALKWKHIETQQIIFCEGHLCKHNPWFSWLPFQPVKGQILTLTTQQPLPETILNFGHWLIPTYAANFRLGATYERDYSDSLPDTAAKNSLLQALTAYYPALAHSLVTAHQAGIRPCTADKKPFLGGSPASPRINIFNGFGSKGGLLIPYYSRIFCDHLLNNKALPDNVNITRYTATYFTGQRSPAIHCRHAPNTRHCH